MSGSGLFNAELKHEDGWQQQAGHLSTSRMDVNLLQQRTLTSGTFFHLPPKCDKTPHLMGSL